MASNIEIDPKTLKRLSRLQPARTAAVIALDWLVIGLSIAFSEWAGHPLVYVLAVLIIGGRMHAFGVLVHDFAHYRFISDKRLSDWIGNVFVGWPILTTIDGYRNNHLAHHRYTNSDRDPDWVIKLNNAKFSFPQGWRTAFANLAAYFVLIGAAMDLVIILPRLGTDNSTRAQKSVRMALYLALAVLFTLTGTWRGFLLYWAVPYATIFFLLLYIRSVAEHFGSMDYSSEMTGTRTVLPHLWEKAFFCPHNVNYHIEHHLYPSVPWYNLPALQKAMLADPDYARHAHLTKGYTTGLLRECVSGPWGEAQRQPAAR